jgi:hypothetical protein
MGTVYPEPQCPRHGQQLDGTTPSHSKRVMTALPWPVVAKELRPLSEALLARPEATAAPPSPAEGSPVSAVRERLRQRRAR